MISSNFRTNSLMTFNVFGLVTFSRPTMLQDVLDSCLQELSSTKINASSMDVVRFSPLCRTTIPCNHEKTSTVFYGNNTIILLFDLSIPWQVAAPYHRILFSPVSKLELSLRVVFIVLTLSVRSGWMMTKSLFHFK